MIRKILIVDDSPIARKMLKSCIPRDQGYEFHEAGDGREAVEKFREIRPDVTFMDLTMPVMNGYEAIEEIIRIDPKAVIIVVTADIQVKAVTKVMKLGAHMVLKKILRKEDVEDALLKAEDTLRKFS
ncbi:MAG: response regulator [Deferribacteres bacterium]|nr:response regulator [Deferribacteres bacterium]